MPHPDPGQWPPVPAQLSCCLCLQPDPCLICPCSSSCTVPGPEPIAVGPSRCRRVARSGLSGPASSIPAAAAHDSSCWLQGRGASMSIDMYLHSQSTGPKVQRRGGAEVGPTVARPAALCVARSAVWRVARPIVRLVALPAVRRVTRPEVRLVALPAVRRVARPAARRVALPVVLLVALSVYHRRSPAAPDP